MENKNKPKYGYGETVVVYPNSDSPKIGIIDKIEITNKTIIDKKGTSEKRKIEYSVLHKRISVFTYYEDSLGPSDKKLHPDAFQVKEGQVIEREGLEYVVEQSGWRTEYEQGSYMGSPEESYSVWEIKARKLNKDGKYNPKEKLMEFDQGEEEAINIVGTLEKKLKFE